VQAEIFSLWSLRFILREMGQTMQAELDTKQQPITKSTSAPAKVSLEKFFRMTEGKFAEWVDGEIIFMAVSDPHQDRVEFLAGLMRHLAEDRKLGKIRTAPYSMKLPGKRIVREPDIMFVSSANVTRITYKYLDGACDVAVEIISPESRTRDRRDKLSEYAQAGITEYWLIDASRQWAQFNMLDEDGVYVPIPLEDEDIFRSRAMPGFWIKLAWLWQEELPTLNEIQRLWGLI
jgi:Uma2 family endonuclease